MYVKGPVYLRIRHDILDKIQRGVWKENDLIPTEKELSKIYNVSRGTVRKAIETLVIDKYLYPRPGFGTIVYQNPDSQIHFTLVQSMTSEMREMGIQLNTLDLELKTVKANQMLASIFNISEGEKLYSLRRVRGVSFPIFYSDTYLLPTFELPKDTSILKLSLYSYLASKGIALTRFVESVSAQITTDFISRKLGVKLSAPILKRIRYAYNASNQLIEYTETYYNAAYYEYRNQISYTMKGLDKDVK